MILADKIIRLRKKNGWSQEELADKLNVSRQAVSKWESAQTIPELDKILQLGELFGVTTDYLLKDEIEEEAFTDGSPDPQVRRVTLAEANEYIEWRRSASVKIAAATFLCIIAVIPLLILGAASETPASGISEELAAVAGLAFLFATVAAAVAIYIFCGLKNAPWEFIDKFAFETEYGVTGMVRERQKAYRDTYMKLNIAGTCICILSPVALIAGGLYENDLWSVVMLSVTLVSAGVGSALLIMAGVRSASMQKLLREGDYSEEKLKKDKVRETVSSIYWLLATAIYLGWSFITEDWGSTWIVWPIAGVLFAAVMTVCNMLSDKKEQ